MSYDRFDLEAQINSCWTIVEELKELPATADINASLHTIYHQKFMKLWDIFEDVVIEQPKSNAGEYAVTRFEVIDEVGRRYTNHSVEQLKLSLQDEGRTLKVFIMGKPVFTTGKELE